MIFLDFLKVKKIMKICSKTYQIAQFPKKFSGKHAPEPPSKRMTTPRVASPPPKKKKIVGLPWQILHTPMNYYWGIYLRIHPGRQLIVCSTL